MTFVKVFRVQCIDLLNFPSDLKSDGDELLISSLLIASYLD